jgi:cholesterol transport system auxiliary component
VSTLSMPVWRTTLRALGVAAVAVALTGCISLFPKAKPATLYKINGDVPAVAASGPAVSTVLRAPTFFSRVASSDRIITTTGPEMQTLAGARWAAPASTMFDEALSAAFTSAAPKVRLLTRGENAPTDMVLRVEVRTFEAQYRNGAGTAPTVEIEARATLNNLRDRGSISQEKIFHAEAPATENRVAPIVNAFDSATSQVVGDIARWTESLTPARRPG